MDRRLALLVVAGLAAALLFVLSGRVSTPSTTTSLATSERSAVPATSGVAPASTLDAVAASQAAAEAVVAQYWAQLSTDAPQVAGILDLPPEQFTSEVGLAEYSGAYGGRYVADCTAGVIVENEVVVDCSVEVLDEPLAEAFGIGATPTQFRVRNGKISRVGYLKPYSTVDLALSAYAAREDPIGFAAACNDPDGTYQSEAGVVYNLACGAFLASLVDAVLAEVRDEGACGADCGAALLNAIRPSRD